MDSKRLPDALWLRIFVELGRYLSTVKESRKDFLGHFEVCLQMARDMADEAMVRQCQAEHEKLLKHVAPTPDDDDDVLMPLEQGQESGVVPEDARGLYERGKAMIDQRRCKVVFR